MGERETLTLKMTTAQVVKTSVTFSTTTVLPIQDYVHPDDHTQPTYELYILKITELLHPRNWTNRFVFHYLLLLIVKYTISLPLTWSSLTKINLGFWETPHLPLP